MKLAKHKPIRDKYNPTPSAKEKRFHLWLMGMPCEACGFEPCGVFHHLLTSSGHKRFRRDHEMGLPLCHICHDSLHRGGDEESWCHARGFDGVNVAIVYRALARKSGTL